MKFYRNNQIAVVNGYGPTESTVCATLNHYHENDLSTDIGKPIANITIYILDIYLNPIPIGAIGELYIGGAGLARGYLNLPDLTAERFIPNLFQTEDEKKFGKNTRLYKTGDLVRYLPDGNLEYIGRNDFQVKIRGFRIELGEIENKLIAYPEIKQAVVLVKEHQTNNEKYLAGYYVADQPLDENAMLDYLHHQLPEYMVPSVLVYLTQLPLTINGKLDRSALPDPELSKITEYVPPRNDLERKVCDIYAAVLGLPPTSVGIRDNFFRLGGNSILAVKLIALLNKKCNTYLKVAELFSSKSILDLIKLITTMRIKYKTIVKLNNAKNKPLMLMIHPGNGGCEVYADLAKRSSNFYACYGIDNYNLYHRDKFQTLHSLSNYYLSLIEKQFDLNNKQTEIILFGWSLGGLISLEIANILEQRSHTRIRVYLLDTIIDDEQLTQLKQLNEKIIKKQIYEYFKKNYNKNYARKIIDNFSIEEKIGHEKISDFLRYTKITLFKAMQKDTTIEATASIGEYIENLPYNNVDKIVRDLSQLTVVNVEQANHSNILKFQEILLQHLVSPKIL